MYISNVYFPFTHDKSGRLVGIFQSIYIQLNIKFQKTVQYYGPAY